MTDHNALTDKALQVPENDLVAVLHAFRESGQLVWHIDRHVLDPDEATNTDIEFRALACATGFTLLRRWSSRRLSELKSGILLSKPYLLIDDGWLEGDPKAAPPHVYICLAINRDAFSPVEHEISSERALEPSPLLTSLLTSNETIRRASGAFEDEPGAWLIELSGST
jgi:hypothetical protein